MSTVPKYAPFSGYMRDTLHWLPIQPSFKLLMRGLTATSGRPLTFFDRPMQVWPLLKDRSFMNEAKISSGPVLSRFIFYALLTL